MKNILLTLLGILLFGAIQAQPAGWQVTGSQYEYSMTMSAGVQMEGTSYGAANDYLAAFVNGTCRGVAEATWVDSYSQYMFFLTVFSNDYSGEEITFKFYSASDDSVYTGFQPETFENGANLGTASNPYQVSDQVQVTSYEVGFTITHENNPVQGAAIQIAGEVLTTDAEGKATLRLEDGNYNYSVEATGFNPESGTLDVSGSSVHKTVALEETLYQVTFNVTDGSVALADAEVIIDGAVLTTDGYGNATTQLTNGIYGYKVSYPGYSQLTDTITVENQSLVESVVLSEKKYTVQFSVYNGSTAIEAAIIDINGTQLTTDAQGVASTELVDGSYDYTIGKTGYQDVSGTVNVSGANIQKEVSLEQQRHTVTFSVLYNNEAQQGADIQIDGSVLTTGSEGIASVDLVNGAYPFSIDLDGFTRVVDTLTVNGAPVVKNVTLSPVTHTVTFDVLYNSEPVEAASIDINNTQLSTGAGGQASIELVDGSYNYLITKPGYQDVSGTVNVSGANIQKEVSLTKQPYNVTFSVNYKGVPQEGAIIQMGEAELYTDAGGLATTKLVNGVYHYTVTTDSLRTYSDSVVVSNQDTTEEIGLLGLLYTLNFHVTYQGDPVPGATVAVDTLESITDDGGQAVFKMEKGVYEYKITSDSLATDSGLVSLTTDPFTQDIQLQEKAYAATFWVNHNDVPIEGAEVTIDNQQLITDAEGSAMIELVDGNYGYTVTKEGYGVVNDSIAISGASVDEVIQLSNETFKLTWNVQCDTGSLANAQVQINDTTLMTDTAGMANLDLFNGIYDYTITKEGFGDVEDTVKIADSDVSKAVMLSDDRYKVAFTVQCDTGFISQAEIHINDTTLLTDEAGVADLQLFNGTYDYQVVREGYGVVRDTLTINGTDVSRPITLSDETFELLFEVQYNEAPIEDAQIHINDSTLLTDASGQASVNLLPGTYDYRVVKEGYQQDSHSVRIAQGSLSRTIDLHPVAYDVDFAVSYDSEPVEHAVIAINDTELVTDSNGVAKTRLIDGLYAYKVSADGLLDTTGSFTVKGAALTEEIKLSSPAYEVTLGVYHETSPVSGADILVDGTQVSTNDDGMAVMELEKGIYEYQVSAEHFETATGSFEVVNTDLTKNILVANIKHDITLVVNHDSQPVEGAQVQISNEPLTTDASGQAHISLENGVYDYSVTHDGYKKATGSITVDHSDVVKNVFLAEQTHSVLFSVSFESEPVDSAMISIEDTTLITGMNGMAEIELVNGDYNYTVTADSLEQSSGSVSVDGSPLVKNIALVPVTYEVTFSVNQGDQPVSNATITIGDVYKVTDQEGQAVFQLENGQYTFNCFANNYEDASGSITISGEPLLEVITMSLITDLEPAEQGKLQVYPNPATNQLHVSNIQAGSLTLMNMKGQVVLQKQGKIAGLDVSGLESGLYLLKIQTKDNQLYTKRLMIR